MLKIDPRSSGRALPRARLRPATDEPARRRRASGAAHALGGVTAALRVVGAGPRLAGAAPQAVEGALPEEGGQAAGGAAAGARAEAADQFPACAVRIIRRLTQAKQATLFRSSVL